jgi:hypothetical protein
MIVLACLTNQCTKFHAVGWTCWFLRPLIWVLYLTRCDFSMDPTKDQHQVCENLRKKMRRIVKIHRDREKAREMKSKVKSTLTSRGLLNNSSWQASRQAKQSIPHTLWCFTATAWKRGKILPRTLAKKELAVASRQQHVLHFHFLYGISDQMQHGCHPPSSLLLSVSVIKGKSKRPLF